MNKLRATVLLAALVLFALAAGGVAWWWLGEDGDDLRLRESHESGGVAEDGEPGAQSGGRGRPTTRRSSEAARPRPSRQVPSEGADGHGQPVSGQRHDEQELASIERVRLELPIEVSFGGEEQPLSLQMLNSIGKEDLPFLFLGGSDAWLFLCVPAAEETQAANASHDSGLSPHDAIWFLGASFGEVDGNSQGDVPAVVAEVLAEQKSPREWASLMIVAGGSSSITNTRLSRCLWQFSCGTPSNMTRSVMLTPVSSAVESHTLTIRFSPHHIQIESELGNHDWALTGRFVTPTGEGVMAAGVGFDVMEPVTGREIRALPLSVGSDGRFFGIGRVSWDGEQAIASGPREWRFAFLVREVGSEMSRHHDKTGGLWQELGPLGVPAVSGRVLNFGDIPWPGRILRIRPPEDVPTVDRRWLMAADSGVTGNLPAQINVRIEPSSHSVVTNFVEDQFPLLGLPRSSVPASYTLTAWIGSSDHMRLAPNAVIWGDAVDGEREVQLVPAWERVLSVHVKSQGRPLDRAVVIPLPANTDELKRHAAAGTLPEFVAAVAKGYGTFDESITTALPYPHVIPADPQGIPGHWIAAAVNGKGAAITWVPITQTEDVVLELGQVGTGVLTRITATMPALAGDAVPGAAAARSMGWRGRLTYLLKARAEGEEHVRDLGKITFGQDGAASAMANLDPSVAWTFFLHQFPEAGVYLPLHDNVEVAALGPFRVQAGETPGVTPAVDLGSVAPPKMIVRHRLMDGLAPLHLRGSIEGTPIDAKPAFAWANGHGCDTSKFVPPCVWDGRAATPLVWQPAVANRDDTKADARPFLDLPANASVVVVSSTHSEFHLRIEGPWWFWGWRWEYTMPLARGQKQRIWLPFGACKLTVTAAAASGSPPGSTGTTPPSKSISVTVAEGWAGDHQVVVE